VVGCGGSDEQGVCLSTSGDGVDADANSSYGDLADGVAVCGDGTTESGCDRLQGSFTAGGVASEDCLAAGYSFYCEGINLYLQDEAACP
jgi:hypothetical protein